MNLSVSIGYPGLITKGLNIICCKSLYLSTNLKRQIPCKKKDGRWRPHLEPWNPVDSILKILISPIWTGYENFFALVLIAFAWVYKAGIYLDSIIPIKIKKHGRRAKSYFKYGLNYIANMLFSNEIDKYY